MTINLTSVEWIFVLSLAVFAFFLIVRFASKYIIQFALNVAMGFGLVWLLNFVGLKIVPQPLNFIDIAIIAVGGVPGLFLVVIKGMLGK